MRPTSRSHLKNSSGDTRGHATVGWLAPNVLLAVHAIVVIGSVIELHVVGVTPGTSFCGLRSPCPPKGLCFLVLTVRQTVGYSILSFSVQRADSTNEHTRERAHRVLLQQSPRANFRAG